MNFWCSHGQCVSPAPGTEPVLEASEPPCRRPGREICLRLFPGQCGVALMLSPPHGSGAGINPRRSQKRVSDPIAVFSRTLSSPSLGDFGSSAKVAALVGVSSTGQPGRMQISAERLGPLCKMAAFSSGPSGSTLGERYHIYQRPQPRKAWMGWVQGSPTSEALRGVRT